MDALEGRLGFRILSLDLRRVAPLVSSPRRPQRVLGEIVLEAPHPLVVVPLPPLPGGLRRVRPVARHHLRHGPGEADHRHELLLAGVVGTVAVMFSLALVPIKMIAYHYHH